MSRWRPHPADAQSVEGAPALHVVVPVFRRCGWIEDYQNLARTYPRCVGLTLCSDADGLRAALATPTQVTILDCRGYPDGSVGNGRRARITLDPNDVRIGATSAVVLGACEVFPAAKIPDPIAALCTGRVVTGGVGRVQNHHTRMLTRRLCTAYLITPTTFNTPQTALSAMHAIHTHLSNSAGSWSTRWLTPRWLSQ